MRDETAQVPDSHPLPQNLPLPASPSDSLIPPTNSIFAANSYLSDTASLSFSSWRVTQATADSTAPTFRPHEPTTDSINKDRPSDATPPERPVVAENVAEYRLMRRVGKGGMGEVWSALQATLARPVAVKRLLPSRLQEAPGVVKEAISEFHMEAMVAGRLEHPNILPIHDLGMDEQGLPLIAMKLVEGKTWAEMIVADFDALTPQDFLAKHLPILVAVSQAVAFAHDRGILHRDLKPGQVMVGQFGEVLLMDWGLAIAWKETARGDAPPLSLPMPSDAPNPAGTPALMAPEQTESRGHRLGPHTDIFLLGGTLYFLLAGTYPYSAPNTLAAMLKATVAEQERPEERLKDRWIPKELADIAMKALSPAIERRHESVQHFIADVTDWMTGAAQRREAQAMLDAAKAELDAGPKAYDAFDTILHRLERARALWPDHPLAAVLTARAREGYASTALAEHDLTLARLQASSLGDKPTRDVLLKEIEAAADVQRRHERQRRLAVGGVIASMFIMLLGGGAFTYSLNESRLAEMRARADAEDMTQFMLGDLSQKLNPIGRLSIMDSVLDRVERTLRRRADEPLSLTEAKWRIKLLHGIADVREPQGDLAAMRLAAERAVTESEALVASVPKEDEPKLLLVDSVRRLGTALDKLGRQEEAMECFQRAMDIVKANHNPNRIRQWDRAEAVLHLLIAEVHKDKGDINGALASFKLGIEAHRRLFAESPKRIELARNEIAALGSVAVIYEQVGQRAEALTYYQEAFERAEKLSQSDPTDANLARLLSSSSSRRSRALRALGRVPEAMAALEISLQISERLAKEDPTNATSQRELAVIWFFIGEMSAQQGNQERAMKASETCVQIFERIVALDPANPNWKRELALAWFRWASAQRVTGDLDAAVDAYSKARRILEEICAAFPADHLSRHSLAIMAIETGKIQSEQGNLEEARENVAFGLAIFQEAHASAKATPTNSLNLGETLQSLGGILKKMNQLDEALEYSLEGLRITEQVSQREPNNATWKTSLALAYNETAAVHMARDERPEALELMRKNLALLRELAAADPTNVDVQKYLAESLSIIGQAYELEGDLENAHATREEAFQNARAASEKTPDRWPVQQKLATTSLQLGLILHRRGMFDEAFAHVVRSADIWETRMKATPQDEEAPAQWGRSLAYLGGVELSKGQLDEAETNLRRADELLAHLPTTDATRQFIAKRMEDVRRIRNGVAPRDDAPAD